jgi:Uma2 family endonuclease
VRSAFAKYRPAGSRTQDADAGVAHLWLIDPDLRTLEIYEREGPHWLLLASHADQDIVRARPFDVIELELAALWV